MIYFFYTLHVMICIFLILVVLLQQGKGADLSVFGGGGTMTAFGARGAATVLHKLTVGSFIAFMITTLAIGVLEGRSENSSVMNQVATEAPAGDPGVPAVEPAGALAEDEATSVEDDATAGETMEEGGVSDDAPASEGASTSEDEVTPPGEDGES